MTGEEGKRGIGKEKDEEPLVRNHNLHPRKGMTNGKTRKGANI